MRRRILLSVALAGVTTWLVAWGLAVCIPMQGLPFEQATSPIVPDLKWRWVVSHYHATGSCLLSAFRQRHPPLWFSDYRNDPPVLDKDGTEWRAFAERLPAWAPMEFSRAEESGPWEKEVVARGWPWLAFRAEMLSFKAEPDEIGGAISLSSRFFDQSLPCWPLWKGLLSNVLVYAAAWWGLLGMLSWSRGRIRRVQGKCAACGYRLYGLKSDRCPECGADVSPSAGTPSPIRACDSRDRA